LVGPPQRFRALAVPAVVHSSQWALGLYARARVNVNLELSRSGNGVRNGFGEPPFRRAVPTTPVDRAGAHVDCFPATGRYMRVGRLDSAILRNLTIPFWKLCRATPLTPVERPPPGKPGPSTPPPPKKKTPPGKAGFSAKDSFEGSGGILGAVLQALVARASGGVQSGSGRGRAGRDGHGPAQVQRPREPIKGVRQL
jgi:hypothetical protein